jgi:hypothetical protein
MLVGLAFALLRISETLNFLLGRRYWLLLMDWMVNFGIHPKTFIFLGGILPMILRGSPFAEKHLSDDLVSTVVHPL